MKSITGAGLKQTGLIFFASATIAFGVQNFVYGDFIMGRAPSWPPEMPGAAVCAYASGMWLIIAGTAMILRWKGWAASLSVALLILCWALIRHILSGHFHWGTEITQTGKAWTLFGGALAMATVMPAKYSGYHRKFLLTGQCCLAAFMIICGIEHFMFAGFVAQLVPGWIPGSLFWTYFTGVALIAGGLGLLIPRTVRMAALLSGMMVFTWFIVLHIPRALQSAGDGNEWIAVFEALAVSGIALVLAGSKTASQGFAPQ